MKPTRTLALTTLVFLFFVQGQRAYFASMFGLSYDALYPAFSGAALVFALLPLLALLLPLVPLDRWTDRRGAVLLAAAGVAIFRLPLSYPSFQLRAIAATLVVGCGAAFLVWAVGYLDRRSLALGMATGVALDQLLRVAGTTWDLSMRSGWLPVQAVLTLAVLALAFRWARTDAPENGASRGLALPGAVGLGVLLFLDLHLLGMAPVVARWARVSWELAAVAVAAGSGIALAVLVLGRWIGRNRLLSVALVVVVGMSILAGYFVVGTAIALFMAAGHAAAILLMAVSLSPVSGRDGRVPAAAGMLTFVAFTAVWSATFFHAYVSPSLAGRGPVLLALGVAILLAVFALMRPTNDASVAVRPWRGVAAAAAVPMTAALLAFLILPGEPDPLPPGEVSGRQLASREIRVGTYNIHYGYDESWRFDPDGIARTIARSGAAIVAMQEVPVGMPTAYGVDLPVWLGRRLGIPSIFAPTTNGLLGDGFLSELPALRVESSPLPTGGGDPRQLLRLNAVLDGRPLNFFAVHLSEDEAVREQQLLEVIRILARVRSVLMGDMNATDGSTMTEYLQEAGMVDAFETAAMPPAETYPASAPTERIDWVFTRGFWVNDAFVVDSAPSDHRMVVATIQSPGVGSR